MEARVRLKTRIRLAWLELASVAAGFTFVMGMSVMRSRGLAGSVDLGLGVAASVLAFAPLCWFSWRRLRRVQDQYAALGPDGSPSADLWTTPRSGIVGVMLLVAALAVALAPALLVRP
jgi:hypothetical protein